MSDNPPPRRGQLVIVGLGPGSRDLLPPRAVAAIGASEVVVGYHPYLEQIADLVAGKQVHASALRHEAERAALAVARARAGQRVCVVSSGDAGIYGMAGLVLELLADTVPSSADTAGEPNVEIVPGITALSAAAARLGAPLVHDFAAISLSDLLTPWEIITARLEAAARADFVAALYNPASARRTWQLAEARRILLAYRAPETPAGLVRNAERPGQEVRLTTLAALCEQPVDMLTTILIGNSQTRARDGRMVTPRGYATGARAAAETAAVSARSPSARASVGDTDDPTRARQSVLLMGHGSRDVAGAAEFGAFAERVAARLDLPLAHGFLELAEPPVVSALERLIAAGAREILAVPWLLLPAGHAKNDLPVAIQAVRRRHPHVRIRYGTPIGVQPEVLAVLADRLAECDPPSATGAAASDGATAVLLVERGSGDPEANAEVHRAARLLWEGRPGYLTVEPAFVGLTWPSVARGLARCAALGARRVIVLPYFLYTGVLVRRIGEQVAVFAADHPEIACHLARHLGQDTRLEALALRLIARARAGEAAMTCDVCQYRAPLLGHEAAAGQAQVSDSGHGLRGAPLPGEEHSHANYHGAHSHSDHREERDAP